MLVTSNLHTSASAMGKVVGAETVRQENAECYNIEDTTIILIHLQSHQKALIRNK